MGVEEMTTFERYIAIAAQRLNDAAQRWNDGRDSEAFEQGEEAIKAIRFAIDQTKTEMGE
jgi:hypothetical protein